MSNKDNGGPAFPNVPDGAGSVWKDRDQGMSLRDYFAIRCPDSEIGRVTIGDINRHLGRENYTAEMEDKAAREIRMNRRYQFADAMLEARK